MTNEKIYELLSNMTLDEKIGQLVQIAGEVFLMEKVDVSTGPIKNLGLSNDMLYNVGSILNIVGTKKIRKVQEEYLSKNRLKIPLLFMADIINGYKTVLPIPLAQGCSWDSNTVYECMKLAGEEAKIARCKCEFFSNGRFGKRFKMGKSYGINWRRRSVFRRNICQSCNTST